MDGSRSLDGVTQQSQQQYDGEWVGEGYEEQQRDQLERRATLPPGDLHRPPGLGPQALVQDVLQQDIGQNITRTDSIAQQPGTSGPGAANAQPTIHSGRASHDEDLDLQDDRPRYLPPDGDTQG